MGVPDRELLPIEQPPMLRRILDSLREIETEYKGERFLLMAAVLVPTGECEDGQQAAVGVQWVGTHTGSEFIELHNRLCVANVGKISAMTGAPIPDIMPGYHLGDTAVTVPGPESFEDLHKFGWEPCWCQTPGCRAWVFRCKKGCTGIHPMLSGKYAVSTLGENTSAEVKVTFEEAWKAAQATIEKLGGRL